ncbi:hypothetical protein HPB50_001980 [Hyalomma asiaticum]|uniref:Uncharacterized protein n=1 Tax=Hyalomma asiaticum TaxID=266040 RepID=A0ACB7RJF0_HYAAI|nr:hypothetical protein HPB50_001980 [Hyalomma asiaticum]
MFATAGEDVQLWSSTTVQPCLRFDVDESRIRTVSCLSWSADGRRLASISQLCDFINVTEFTKTKHRHVRTSVEGACYCCAFSHNDSSSLCVGLVDGSVQLLRNGKVAYAYKPHKDKVTRVSYNENNSFVASGAYDGSVALLAIDTRTTRVLNSPTGKAVVGLEWSCHNRFKLVTTSMDGNLCIWDGSTRCLKSKHAVHPLRGASCLSLSPVNESLAVTAGHDGRLVLFDMLTTSEQASVTTPETLESIAFLPDGQRVLGGGTSGRVYLYDLRSTRQTPPSTFEAHSKPVTAIATMQTQEAEGQMMAFVKSCASRAKEAAVTDCVPRIEIGLPCRFSLGSDMDAALDLVMTSTPYAGALSTSSKNCSATRQPSDEVFKEAQESSILDASWTSSGNSAIGPRHRNSFRFGFAVSQVHFHCSLELGYNSCTEKLKLVVVEFAEENWNRASKHFNVNESGSVLGKAEESAWLSDFMPVLNDSTVGLESRASGPNVSGEVRGEDASQAAAAVRDSLPINGTGGSVHSDHSKADSSSASSNSVLLASRESSKDQEIEVPAAMDVEKQPEDCALAQRVSRLEEMLSDQGQKLEKLTAQTRHIDGHLLHVHMEMTMMQHSFMRDIQGMLQQVFDEVATLRSEIAELRGES